MALNADSPRSIVGRSESGVAKTAPRPWRWDQGVGIALALIGYWLPWLSVPPAALRLNGYDLAEWMTFLPGYRDGTLPLTRLSLLAPLACLGILCAIASARSPMGSPARWGLIALALICIVNVLPVYPYLLTAYSDPEFQPQFFTAGAAVLAVALTFVLPHGLLNLAQLLLALAGAWYGAAALLTLRPAVSELLNGAWSAGPGWAAMLGGFALLAAGGWRGLFGPRV